MTKTKLVATPSKKPRLRVAEAPDSRPEALGPGIHAGLIEPCAGATYRVRTLTGDRFSAILADGVDRALAEECLRDGRTVLLADSPRGVLVLGAVQTQKSAVREADGSVTIEGKDVRVRAERALVLDAGPVSIRAERNGVIRIEGEKMVVDVSALVRFLSARVEVP
jgi:hypothetical protein